MIQSTPPFVWISFAWTIIFSFPLRLYLSLEQRWVSWRQHIVGSCFFQSIQLLCACGLMHFIHVHLGCLLIYEDLVQSFYLLLNGCCVSLLFLFPCVLLCYFVLCAVFLHFHFLFVWCLSSRLSFCGYHEVFIKCFIDKSHFYFNSVLFSFAYTSSVLFFLPFYILSQINPFLCCAFFTKLQ